MADYRETLSCSGRLYYARRPLNDPPRGYFRSRTSRPHILHITRNTSADSLRTANRDHKSIRRYLTVGKLAGTRDNAKRFFRFVAQATNLDQGKTHEQGDNQTLHRLSAVSAAPSTVEEMLSGAGGASGTPSQAPSIGGPVSGMVHRPRLEEDLRTASTVSARSTNSTAGVAIPIEREKPIASGNGISVSVALAEPMLFLQGFDHSDMSERNTTMLRGSLHLRISKPAKIKTVYLKFRGRAETEWPEGETLSCPQSSCAYAG